MSKIKFVPLHITRSGGQAVAKNPRKRKTAKRAGTWLRNRLTGNVFKPRYPIASYFGTSNCTSDGRPIYERVSKPAKRRAVARKNPAISPADRRREGARQRKTERKLKSIRKRKLSLWVICGRTSDGVFKHYLSAGSFTTKKHLASRWMNKRDATEAARLLLRSGTIPSDITALKVEEV